MGNQGKSIFLWHGFSSKFFDAVAITAAVTVDAAVTASLVYIHIVVGAKTNYCFSQYPADDSFWQE